MTTKNRIKQLEQLAATVPPATRTSRPALLASVMAKAERALRDEALEPADWTNAPAALREHRDKLLTWVLRQRLNE